MADEDIDVRVQLKETGKFHAESRKVERDIDKIGDAAERSGKKSADSSSKFGKLGKDLGILHRVIGLVKPAALITGLGLAAQGASALAAGGIAAASALAPLAGLMAAYPALALAAGQAVGVWSLGMKQLGAAMGGNAQALKRLTPEGQRFVKTMRPQLQHLQAIAQKPLFAGLEQGLKGAHRNLGLFRNIVRDTAKEEGGLIAMAGRRFGSKQFGADLQTIAGRNIRLINMGGRAALNLADAARNILVAAGPLVDWLGRVGLRTSALIKSWSEAGRASGRLARFFGETRRVATILGGTLVDLSFGLINVGKAAYPLGLSILHVIREQARAFRDWTGSISGQNALADFFQRAKAPLWEAGRLIRDIGRAFFSLSQGNQVAPLIRQVRTQLLPVLVDMVNSTTKSFGPHLISFLVQATKMFGLLAGSSGPLTIFVDLLTAGAKAFNWMADNIPGFKAVVVTIVGALGIIKALSWAKMITGITGVSAAFTRLGISATGAAAAETRAAEAGGLSGAGGLLPGAAGRSRGGAPFGPMTRNQSRLSRLQGVGSGLAGAAGPVGWGLLIAQGVREGIQQTGFKPTALPDILSGNFGKNISANLTKLTGLPRVKFGGPLGLIPEGTVKVKARLDPKSLPTLTRQINSRFRSIGAQTSASLAAGLRRTRGRLPLSFQRSIFNQLSKLPPKFRKEAELSMIGFSRQMEKSGAVPKGTTSRLIRFLEAQFGHLPGNVGRSADAAAKRANLALSDIHKTAVSLIPGIGPLIKTNLVGPLQAARDAAKETNNSLLNLPTVSPSGKPGKKGGVPTQASGGLTLTPGWSWVGEEGPELAFMGRGAVVQPLRGALASPHVPAPLMNADAGPVQLELVAHHDIRIGQEAVARAVTRHAAKVRRKKSRVKNG